VTLKTTKEARQAVMKKLSLAVHHDEAKRCGMLQKALHALGTAVGGIALAAVRA